MMMRIHTPRMPFPAISLSSDTSVITAIANDSGADKIFSRQVEGIAMLGDTVICFSARGHSPAVIEGVKAAKKAGCEVIALLGRNGGKLFDMVDVPILIQSDRISSVHVAHTVAMHVIADMVEQGFDRMVNEIGESS
jgi:D-sedoheptulose 7-phosphate isomerase